VVASRIGATPEFVHDGADGFLVPPDRLEAFAEKIVFLLTHPEAARAMGARAAEATRHLKPGHYVPGMVEVYRNLAKAE
jgi:glycosyltransferase involved in cell wall biosynthesis